MDTPSELLESLRYEKGQLYYSCNKGKMREGAVAGNRCRGRYLGVGHKGSKYAVHHIVWELHNGPVPKGKLVDHINRDFLDNRIENLRLADFSENSANSNRGANRNCYWHEPTASWHVRVQFRGEMYHDGYYKSIALARAAAARLRELTHKEFTGSATKATAT